MKKLSARILCVVLAITVILVPLLNVSASAVPDYDHDCPYIYVHGFMGVDIYEDPDDPDSEALWPPSVDGILDAVKDCLPDIAKFLVTRDWDTLGNSVIPKVQPIFDEISLDASGNPKGKTGVRFTYPEPDTVTADSNLNFCYDWRIDPVIVAGQLNDFVNYVCECADCEQVVIECHSYGGVICTSYAKLYGTEKVRSFLYNSTAVYGETYTGELMNGQMSLDADVLTAYLDCVLDHNEYEKLLDGLFKLLNDAGLTDAICGLGNKILDHLLDQAAREVVVPMFGGWLSIWAMVPDEALAADMNYVFGNLYKDDGIDHSGLIEKIENYNTKVRPYKTETLRQINENCNFYIFARYGYCSVFLTPSWANSSDTVIDTKFASFGATAADYGKQLSDADIAGIDEKYISPDKAVNASTCMFPEQTWFIRRLAHASNVGSLYDMGKVLLYSDEQATCDTYEAYPRFLYYDAPADSIVPDTLADAKTENFLTKIVNFIRGIFEKIKSLFTFNF